MPSLSRITVYPLKSFDGHEVSTSEILTNGALAEDRRFALVDSWGKYVNGKNCAAIHRIRATYSDDLQTVSLSCDGQHESFELNTQQEQLAAWCSDILGQKCRVIENTDGGFPDDSELSGPTLVSTASLQTVSEWFEGLDLAEVRRRFRFNLEVTDAPEFWEDSLVPEPNKVRRFRVGPLVWQSCGICMRCVVPTRDSLDGTVTAGFASSFNRQREQTLPAWAARERFDHFYRFGVNTRLDSSEHGNIIRVGDVVELATGLDKG